MVNVHDLQIRQGQIGRFVSILVIFGHETFRSVGYDTAEPSIQERQKNKNKQCRLNYNLLKKETIKEPQRS